MNKARRVGTRRDECSCSPDPSVLVAELRGAVPDSFVGHVEQRRSGRGRHAALGARILCDGGSVVSLGSGTPRPVTRGPELGAWAVSSSRERPRLAPWPVRLDRLVPWLWSATRRLGTGGLSIRSQVLALRVLEIPRPGTVICATRWLLRAGSAVLSVGIPRRIVRRGLRWLTHARRRPGPRRISLPRSLFSIRSTAATLTSQGSSLASRVLCATRRLRWLRSAPRALMTRRASLRLWELSRSLGRPTDRAAPRCVVSRPRRRSPSSSCRTIRGRCPTRA